MGRFSQEKVLGVMLAVVHVSCVSRLGLVVQGVLAGMLADVLAVVQPQLHDTNP